jgi:ABC-type cobalamin/Fe3+-siderophores transport system ATPase subunit
MAPVLTLDCVSLCYQRARKSTMVLHDVTMTLEAGELAGVWGRRGAGKSTLACVAAGTLAPDRGAVLLDGEPLARAGRGVLHAEIGLATRRGPELDEMPVEDWIASALLLSHSYRDALRLAHRALERTGVIDVATGPWSDLSDGERMLASLAQAIVRGPRVLIVDDPVAGLGAAERDEVMQLLTAVAATGVAVLITAAELLELRGLDRIWSLRDGRLDGPSVRPGGTVIPLRADG